MPGGGHSLGKGVATCQRYPSACRSGCVPLIVLGEPAEWLLMFPFAFGCRLGSVFSFPGWSHSPRSPHPSPPFLLALLFAVVE